MGSLRRTSHGAALSRPEGMHSFSFLLLEATHLLLIASLLLVAMPGAPSSVLVTTGKALLTSSDALVPNQIIGA